MRRKQEDLPIYTADLETDPFSFGNVPEAFVCGFFDGNDFVYFWGDDWLERFTAHLLTVPPGIIYLHNGGKFDFYYMMTLFAGSMMIRNGRIMKAVSDKTPHQFRDSYAIMPFPLATYKKDDIDINLLTKENRDANHKEIVSYLKTDCVALWELCTAFRRRFGDRITIGGTAMRELQACHSFQTLTGTEDRSIRDSYFYGGRVQCFRKGIVKAKLNVYDVNSMYPAVMRNYEHPIGKPTRIGNKISRNTCFISVSGKNYGAFPTRKEDGGIDFTKEEGIFHVTIHEWKTALRYGLFEPHRIIKTVDFERRSTFQEFVDKFFDLRLKAKITDDLILSLFYKFILNSAYGKFAQNVDNFFDYEITEHFDGMENAGWKAEYIIRDKYIIWKRPSDTGDRGLYNVATGCSITGAARSVLLESIANAVNPVYCDTDSLICESLSGVELDDNKLGAWKTEASGNEMAIGGKKLYALFGSKCGDCKGGFSNPKRNKKGDLCRHHFHRDHCVKQANKGVRISPEDIRTVAKGKEVIYIREAPSYKLNGDHKFLTRRVNMR